MLLPFSISFSELDPEFEPSDEQIELPELFRPLSWLAAEIGEVLASVLRMQLLVRLFVVGPFEVTAAAIRRKLSAEGTGCLSRKLFQNF